MDYKEKYETMLKEYRQVFETLDQNSMREFIELIKKHDRIFCIGVGREGMMTRAFAMRLGDGSIGHIDYVCRRAKEAGAYICVVTGSPSGKTAKEVADQVFFIPACVYRGTDPVVPSFQPMGNLFEQCLLMVFDVIVMTLVDEIPDLTFEKMSMRHRNVE